jgi:hypothetical protein
MSRRWSSAVFLRYPSCGLRELAVFRRTTYQAVYGEHYAGQLEHLVMRTVSGEVWQPSGRIQFDAVRVREHLDEAGRKLFDVWQERGRGPMDSPGGTDIFLSNAQDSPLRT